MIFTNVSRLCKDRGISIARLERDLGIGNATIRNWNVSSPTVDKLKLVADYFGVTLDELLAEPDSSAVAAAEVKAGVRGRR